MTIGGEREFEVALLMERNWRSTEERRKKGSVGRGSIG